MTKSSRVISMSSANSKNVILGIGNKALSDDAAGIKVARHIIKNHPKLTAFHIIDGGLLNYEMTSVLENAQNLIIIEAATLGHAPGTISTLIGTDMDNMLKRVQRNATETALADMFEMARLARHLPPNRALVTVEPKKTSWGNRLSASVAKAIPQLAENALTMMSHWTGLPFREPESKPQTSHTETRSPTSNRSVDK
ncbi:MAG: hydrogenase maturation protease [Gammaproteobacteria bacterium]|jgi:hydrogenase maturation protease|nr:hydrogenase maturation protease [Gammaproteobacteria bacterium]